MAIQGTITREHTVWCGICSNLEQFGETTKHATRRAARKSGWKFTRKYGWVCYRDHTEIMKTIRRRAHG